MKRNRNPRPPLTREAIDLFAVAPPRFARRDNGGWLAVTPDGLLVCIAVQAWQVDGARNRYESAREDWVRLLNDALVDPYTPNDVGVPPTRPTGA